MQEKIMSNLWEAIDLFQERKIKFGGEFKTMDNPQAWLIGFTHYTSDFNNNLTIYFKLIDIKRYKIFEFPYEYPEMLDKIIEIFKTSQGRSIIAEFLSSSYFDNSCQAPSEIIEFYMRAKNLQTFW